MKKRPPMEMEAGPDEIREGEDDQEMPMPKGKTNRKRSAKGAKQTKAPMDGGMYGKKPMDGGMYGKKPMDGEGCGCGGRKGKGKCDGNCGKKMDRNDALTPQEYLAACDLGIQGRSRSYIRARLDAAERLDLKCGKGAISQGEKCTKGPAQKVDPKIRAAQQIAARTSKSGKLMEYSSFNQKTGKLDPVKSQKAQGPSALVQAGQVAKGIGRGALETVKWTSGYNIGKTLATGMTGGKNEKGSTAGKVASVAASTLVFGPQAGFGAARRVGAFGNTDLQQHAINEKKEKKWRKSVGYKDGMYAKGFKVDYAQLGM